VNITSILCELAQIFLFICTKDKTQIILIFAISMATKKVGQKIFFPSFFVAVIGSGIIKDPDQG
jgi:hypothetical protein